MKIAIIGKFQKIYDEEYIARSFESLGHTVIRIQQTPGPRAPMQILERERPDVLVFTKLKFEQQTDLFIRLVKDMGIKTVCWLFDLYWGYHREFMVKTAPYFKADLVVTTDNGHENEWKKVGIKHACVRQGIFKDECYMKPIRARKYDVVFVGSDNPIYPERGQLIRRLEKQYNLKWFGRFDTDELRSTDLNDVYAETAIVVGDSYPSPEYWSNRVVETLGRGGFLIHREVAGLKNEYPDLVTYDGTYADLCSKIDYYLEHEEERQAIIKKNYDLVRSKYTMDKKCDELICHIRNSEKTK